MGFGANIVTIQRRQLKFDSFDEVVRDAESLQAKGYDRAGKWDLAQVCEHLARWLEYPLDGMPRVTLLLKPPMWVVRHTIGPRMLRKAIATNRIPAGSPAIPQTVAASGGDAAEALDHLRRAAKRFTEWTGPTHPSPMFGRLTRDDGRKMHLVHAAHHLSFLIPKQG